MSLQEIDQLDFASREKLCLSGEARGSQSHTNEAMRARPRRGSHNETYADVHVLSYLPAGQPGGKSNDGPRVQMSPRSEQRQLAT